MENFWLRIFFRKKLRKLGELLRDTRVRRDRKTQLRLGKDHN